MTTGSSSPRSPEYAISALDLPTGETTTGTGTARLSGAAPGGRNASVRDPDVRDADIWETGFDEPRAHDADRPDLPGPGLFDDDLLDEDLLDLDPHDARPHDPDRHEPGARETGRHQRAAADAEERAYGDPVGDLVRAAVADRPLDEVVDLITTLERSPQYAQATVDALRAVGVNRSVEDVTRLVGLLTRPPRQPDSADEAIRAAAECRSVEDVTRLMALLHRTPLEPHCGREAVRAAATGRPVEELVELIGRLAEDGHERPERPDARQLRAEQDAPDEDDGHDARGRGPAGRPARRTGVFAAADRRGRERGKAARPARRERDREDAGRGRGSAGRDRLRERAVRRTARGPAWPAWLTVAVLAGCGVAFFPFHRAGASAGVYGVALGLSALCLVLALLLTVRPAVPLLAAGVVVPAALAAAKLYGSATPSSPVSRVVDLTPVPLWAAVAVAVAASLVALMALCVRVAARDAVRRRRPARRVTATAGAGD
ncbi:hypothetical protein [Streptomyces parvulus]|uniref:Uncharacterized protein n=1 Tax=Streptomyces parvulus TaxID=146923 RepID=A0A191V7L8_9ACTN|nr:hypothetical protein [Streptomyces parvulus]ANJ10888.1 hypothetical protein Spa2297_30230 [Streptomyces parvulus]GGR68041.1 hypothetical protein GCM10010220_19940 [Streptomyces parvulus]